jgi:hypothetical protein
VEPDDDFAPSISNWLSASTSRTTVAGIPRTLFLFNRDGVIGCEFSFDSIADLNTFFNELVQRVEKACANNFLA